MLLLRQNVSIFLKFQLMGNKVNWGRLITMILGTIENWQPSWLLLYVFGEIVSLPLLVHPSTLQGDQGQQRLGSFLLQALAEVLDVLGLLLVLFGGQVGQCLYVPFFLFHALSIPDRSSMVKPFIFQTDPLPKLLIN